MQIGGIFGGTFLMKPFKSYILQGFMG